MLVVIKGQIGAITLKRAIKTTIRSKKKGEPALKLRLRRPSKLQLTDMNLELVVHMILNDGYAHP